MAEQQQTPEEAVYAWAVQNDVPSPDAFAMTYWDLAGKAVRLRFAAAVWRRRVAAGKTGIPWIDQGE